MRIKIIALLITFGAIFLLSCGQTTPISKVPSVSLREEWFPSACFAGDMAAVYKTGSANGINIKVEAGAEDVDPVKLVIARNNDFGVAGADRIITANGKGADLVIIGVVNYKSPTVFLSLKDRKITAPKDFEGHTIGVMTGNNTEYIYRSLLEKAKVDKAKIKEVEAPFDLTTFVAKVYDVRPAFAYDEPVSLDAKSIEYDTIRPEEYGVNFIGPVIFARRDYIEKNRQAVQRFISALVDGWKYALENPAETISFLKQFDANIDADREIKSLVKGKEYFSGEQGKPLFLSNERWELFLDELVGLKLISEQDRRLSVFDRSFLDNYYKLGK
jgi:NitT/TauT family transport system substrate-binding protein